MIRYSVGAILLIILTACSSPGDRGALPTATAEKRQTVPLQQKLIGTWVRSVGTQSDALEGIRFDADGRFGFIGIHTMNGLQWRAEANTLVLTTNTSRYPEPLEGRFEVADLSADTLVLNAPKDYLAGDYRRDDSAANRVTGTVAYRVRMALPPEAFIYVTLSDVSRQDVPAVLIADQTIPMAGRQVPVPFHIYYATADIDPRFTYQVRADIIVAGRRRFITTRAYPVITRDHPSDVDIWVDLLPARKQSAVSPVRFAAAMAAEKKIAVEDLELPATYSGRFERPQGVAKRVTLNLFADRTFHIREEFAQQSGQRAEAYFDLGRWYLTYNGAMLVLVGGTEGLRKFAIEDVRRLRMLNNPGEAIDSQGSFLLKHTDRFEPIEAAFPMTGMFTYLADAALFKECLTEKRFPVARAGDYLALERAYLKDRRAPGEPLLVSLEAGFIERPKMEGRGLETALQVERFIKTWPEERCPDRNALAELENTYWKLTELNGKSVRAVEGRREPHMRLMAAEKRVSGFSGCNHFFGNYTVRDETLRFDAPMGATLMACLDDDDTERRFFEALQATRTYKIIGEMLELTEGNSVVARFQAMYFK